MSQAVYGPTLADRTCGPILLRSRLKDTAAPRKFASRLELACLDRIPQPRRVVGLITDKT